MHRMFEYRLCFRLNFDSLFREATRKDYRAHRSFDALASELLQRFCPQLVNINSRSDAMLILRLQSILIREQLLAIVHAIVHAMRIFPGRLAGARSVHCVMIRCRTAVESFWKSMPFCDRQIPGLSGKPGDFYLLRVPRNKRFILDDLSVYEPSVTRRRSTKRQISRICRDVSNVRITVCQRCNEFR